MQQRVVWPRRHVAKRTDLCLVVPPFDSVHFPALGVSVLASAVQARGLSVRTVYGSILLASRMGLDSYDAACKVPIREMMGERLFLDHAYAPDALATLGPSLPFSADVQRLFDATLPLIAPFVEALGRQVLATRPRIVGITTNFQQTMAAIAVARFVKQRAPDICVVLGGANVAQPMGDGLAGVFPWIDHVFSGEADTSFPAFCEQVVRKGSRPSTRVVQSPPITNMSVVSAPDFSDYFAALRHFQRRGRLPASLPAFITMETSRGCWWGEKNHCTFCGLNGDGMAFRKKPAARVLEEIRALTHRWGTRRIHFSDNIMPLNFFDDLLPTLAEWPERPRLFFEVKANLRDDQLALMERAGVDTIQPGIESFSTNVLKLMRKGVSGLQNVALLRSAQARGVTVVWNLLFGFPGERVEDYESMLALIPKIEHLHPPSGCNRLIVDRYSPYHSNHKGYGIPEIFPFPNYRAIFPADAPVSDMVYHFRGTYTTPVLSDPAILAALRASVATWIEQWRKGAPYVRAIATGPDKWVIADTRRVAVQALVPVSAKAVAALAYFERPKPRAGQHQGHDDQIDELLARHLLIEHENALLSVVARPIDEVATRTGEAATHGALPHPPSPRGQRQPALPVAG